MGLLLGDEVGGGIGLFFPHVLGAIVQDWMSINVVVNSTRHPNQDFLTYL